MGVGDRSACSRGSCSCCEGLMEKLAAVLRGLLGDLCSGMCGEPCTLEHCLLHVLEAVAAGISYSTNLYEVPNCSQLTQRI